MVRGFVMVVLAALVVGPPIGEAAPASANAVTAVVTGAQNVRVTPKVGGAKATFTFSFTTPITTGVGVKSTIYETVQGATTNLVTINKGGCISTFDIAAPYAATGGRVSTAARPSTHWCAGTYRGSVVELKVPTCATGKVCARTNSDELGAFGNFTFKVT